jgi:hypothetical protein
MPAGFCVGRPNAAVAVVVLRDRTEDVVAPSVILVVVAALNILLLSSVRRKVKPRPVRRIDSSAASTIQPIRPRPSVVSFSELPRHAFFSFLTMSYYI